MVPVAHLPAHVLHVDAAEAIAIRKGVLERLCRHTRVQGDRREIPVVIRPGNRMTRVVALQESEVIVREPALIGAQELADRRTLTLEHIGSRHDHALLYRSLVSLPADDRGFA